MLNLISQANNTKEGNKMENQYLVTWQYDNEGDAGLVKVMSCDTLTEAVTFMEKSAKVAVIRDRSADMAVVLRWVSPTFTGAVARSLAA
jgi:pterin-4a-carbinolamine dehydratase